MSDSLPELWNCPEAFEFVCSKKWDGLQPTELANVRHCETCNERVYWSANPEEFAANAKLGRCVAVPCQGMPLTGGELAGRVSPEYHREITDRKARYQLWRNGWQLVLDRDPSFILFLIGKNYPAAFDLFVELVKRLPVDRELADRAYLLLAKSPEKSRFVLYLLEIGEIDRALAISDTIDNFSHHQQTIAILLKLNLLELAQARLQKIDPVSRPYFIALNHIANRMAELEQPRQAIDLYEHYLSNINKHPDLNIQNTIATNSAHFQQLDIFVNLINNYPVKADLVAKAGQVFADDKSRKQFSLYLLKTGRSDLAVAIIETLANDGNLVMYAIAKLREMHHLDAAMQLELLQQSGRV